MSWEASVVDRLRFSKRHGLPFQAAWRDALEKHPPKARTLGPATPTLFDADTGDTEVTLLGFFERVAREAYCDVEDATPGHRPALRGFTVDLLAGFGDESEPVGRERVAA